MNANPISRQETIDRILRHWGIAHDCISKAHLWEEEAKQLSEHMDKTQKGFFLFGAPGRRKTTCATAILKYELQRRYDKKSPYGSIYFIFLPDLLMELQECFLNKTSASDIVYNVCEYEFLVLDGLGEGGKQSDFVVGKLDTIFHHRHADRIKKRTIVTCNYNLRDVATFIDARISSRIEEMCNTYEFTGEDFRMKR